MNKFRVIDIYNLRVGKIYILKFNFDFIPMLGQKIYVNNIEYKVKFLTTKYWDKNGQPIKKDMDTWDIIFEDNVENQICLLKGEEYSFTTDDLKFSKN